MTSKRTRRTQAKQRRRQIGARRSIEEQRQRTIDGWFGPAVIEKIQRHTLRSDNRYTPDPPRPGDLVVFDWSESPDDCYCVGYVDECGVHHVYHADNCPKGHA